jgi:hypothetical protein
MRTTKAQWIAVLTVALSTGTVARAHGFVFTGGFAPPPLPPGLGAPGTPSNGGPSGFPGSTGAGGGSGATPPVAGGTTAPPPSGGGGGGTPGIGGSTPGVGGGPAGGGTPRSSGSGPVGGGSGPNSGGNGGVSGGGNGRPSGRPSVPAPAGSGRGPAGTPAGGGRSFGGSVAARPPAEPWLDEMRIEWNSEFLPYDKTDQYAAVAVSAQDALRRPVEAGGWRRADRPTLVVFVDAADPTHAKALRALDSDHRLRVATKLFNCFRVDAGSKSFGGELGFAAFRADGTPRRGDQGLR